ncbi:hypothetical protein ANO14919_008850 [Xylariales sp. No.14919]|nr:hypothetical protein ANO14919_008850 [Xylariales sp. No.14919]
MEGETGGPVQRSMAAIRKHTTRCDTIGFFQGFELGPVESTNSILIWIAPVLEINP